MKVMRNGPALGMGLVLCCLGFHFMPAACPDEALRSIPVAEGLASHPVNGGQCLISDGRHQYMAFYDGEHRMTVARRDLGGEAWTFAKLPEKVGWDTHNRILIFLDRAGHLHLTGNMHASRLRYYRTEKPGDITSFKGIHTWTGKHEERVTYPTLLRLRDGSVHILYRNGGSGDGMRLLIHYDEEMGKWTGTGDALISGRDREPTCNAYPFGGIVMDGKGTLHIGWCWRETPDVRTNFDICYARSMDGGQTWQRWDGSKYALPIRPKHAEVADDVPQDAGLMNGGTFVVDGAGRPYVGYTRFDENGHNQLFVATPVEKGWQVIQLTDWKGQFQFEGRGTIPRSPAVPKLKVISGGRLEVAFSNPDVTPTSGRFLLTREALLKLKPGGYTLLPSEKVKAPIPNLRAVNHGPLPEGQVHYMQQEVASPNRDRKPRNPKPPTMIYLVEKLEN